MQPWQEMFMFFSIEQPTPGATLGCSDSWNRWTELELEFAVSYNIRYDALLGRDVPFLWNLGSHLQVPDYIGLEQTHA